MNSFYSYSCPAALALNYNGTAGAASCSACACPYNNISTAAGSRCCGTNSCPYSASALSNLNCPYAAAYNTASHGCSACGNGYSSASCNTPVFLSAYASTPQCTSCSGAVIFDHLNTMSNGIETNESGTVFTLCQSGIYRVFYTLRTQLSADSSFAVEVNGIAQPGTEACVSAGTQAVTAEAVLRLNAGDNLVLRGRNGSATVNSANFSIIRLT